MTCRRWRARPHIADYIVEFKPFTGSPPRLVAARLKAFETSLQSALARLDAAMPEASAATASGLLNVAIEAVATHYATWLRIHPFADGNGRAARVLANWMLARYWHPAGTVTARPDGSRGRHHAGDRHRR
jgi:hypothetical protein